MCNITITPIKRSGTLWEGRYRATIVDSEQYLLKLMRYNRAKPSTCQHDRTPCRLPLEQLCL